VNTNFINLYRISSYQGVKERNISGFVLFVSFLNEPKGSKRTVHKDIAVFNLLTKNVRLLGDRMTNRWAQLSEVMILSSGKGKFLKPLQLIQAKNKSVIL